MAQKFFFAIALIATLLPGVAFAGPTPTAAEPYCYTYSNAGVRTNSCFATEPACIADSSGRSVESICGLVGNPDASTLTPAQINASNNVIDASKAAYLTKKEPSGGFLSWIMHPLDSAGAVAMAGLGLALKAIAFLVFTLAGYFLVSMATILDLSIRITLDSQILGGLAFVSVGWTAIRDLSNMFFIFALLYLAIRTILGMGGGGAKRLVANLIIAALLINFSLFFTKVVIDAGNVLAVSFWDKLKVQQGPYTISSASSKALGGLDLQTMWSDKTSKVGAQIDSLDSMVQAELYAGGAILMFIAGYVFLAAALMMVTRTIMLLLLMVFSPFAFLSFAMPGMSRHGSEWLGKLIKQTFVAPLFLFMMYLNSVLVDSVDLLKLSGSNDATWSAALIGDPRGYAIILNFILMIGFLLASIAIANSYAGSVGSGARGLAKKFITRGTGYAFAGGAAVVGATGRQTFGAAGKRRLDNDAWMKEQNRIVARAQMKDATWADKAKARIANAKISGAEALKQGTYDVRNAPLKGLGVPAALKAGGVDVGQGTKRTYATSGQPASAITGGYRGTEKEKELIALAKDRYKGDPAAQRAFLIQRGVELDQSRNKELKAELDRGMIAQKHKETIKEAPIEMRKKEAEIAALKKDRADGKPVDEVKLAEAEKDLTTATEGLVTAVKGLTGKEFVEAVKQKDLGTQDADGKWSVTKPEIVRAMGRQQLAYLNTNPDVYDLEIQKGITNEVMLNGQPEARQYLVSQARMNNGVFPPNLKEELRRQSQKYKDSYAELNKGPDDESTRTALAKLREENDNAMQDILSGMAPKEVASMKGPAGLDLKSDPMVARHYTKKHLELIGSYHKNIAQDTEKPEVQIAMAKIRDSALHGTSAEAKKYMTTEAKNPNSVFFDNGVKSPETPAKKDAVKNDKQTPEDEDDEESDDNNFPRV